MGCGLWLAKQKKKKEDKRRWVDRQSSDASIMTPACWCRFLQLPFSRRAEAEADLIGLKLASLAGYDPRVLLP